MTADAMLAQYTEALTNQIIKDLEQSIQNYPVSAPVTNTAVASDPQPTQQSAQPSNPGQKPKRLSRQERIAQEQQDYQDNRNQQNNDILLKGLGIAGALGVGAIAGRKGLLRGAELADDYHKRYEVGLNQQNLEEYIKTRPSILDPRFWAAAGSDQARVADQKQRLQEIYSNPLKTIGAAAYRLGLDVASDGTRSKYWRYNHPLAITSSALNRLVDPMQALSATDKAGMVFLSALPAVAASGAYDITNPAELFRPSGFKQNMPESDNPRQSTEPATELVQRFFMGRTGRPLSYGEALKEIPDLTPERYKNYLLYTYQDKGPGNLGLIKYTDENLQGNPEVRVLGYPVTIPMVTTAALAGLGSAAATSATEIQYRNQVKDEVLKRMDIQQNKQGQYEYKAYERGKPTGEIKTVMAQEQLPDPTNRRVIQNTMGAKPSDVMMRQRLGGMAGIAAGATAGYFLGNYLNSLVANTRNNTESLPTTQEYGVS